MTYALRFLHEVEEDVIAGYGWYEDKVPGLGEEFLRVFYSCSGEVSRNPMLYPGVHREFRRCLLRRFPYAIYFKVEADEVIVLGLVHCARDPRAIGKNLRERTDS